MLGAVCQVESSAYHSSGFSIGLPALPGRGRPPQAAARRAGLEFVEKVLTAMIWVGALGGWSDSKSHRPDALKLICRPAAEGFQRHPPVGRT